MLSADRGGLDSAGARASTHWVALISIEMGTLGPLRMSALIHSGLRIRPASVSCRRRSREGPTALRLLKSSLMPAGNGQGLGNWTLTCWAERAGNSGWTALRRGEPTLKRAPLFIPGRQEQKPAEGLGWCRRLRHTKRL